MVDHESSSRKRRAFITGASRGLGRAIADALAPRFSLALGVRGGVRENAAATETEGIAIDLELADPVSCRSAVSRSTEALGGLDLLVLNGAISEDALLLRISDDSWDRVIAVNLTSAFHLVRAAIEPLKKSRGAVIFISSIIGRRGAAGSVNYAAAKAGMIGMALTLADELAPEIRVNVVIPGYMETEMGLASPVMLNAAKSEHPLGIATPLTDAARLVAAVAELATVTGQIFTADGRATRWY